MYKQHMSEVSHDKSYHQINIVHLSPPRIAVLIAAESKLATMVSTEPSVV